MNLKIQIRIILLIIIVNMIINMIKLKDINENNSFKDNKEINNIIGFIEDINIK